MFSFKNPWSSLGVQHIMCVQVHGNNCDRDGSGDGGGVWCHGRHGDDGGGHGHGDAGSDVQASNLKNVSGIHTLLASVMVR